MSNKDYLDHFEKEFKRQSIIKHLHTVGKRQVRPYDPLCKGRWSCMCYDTCACEINRTGKCGCVSNPSDGNIFTCPTYDVNCKGGYYCKCSDKCSCAFNRGVKCECLL